jgi:hypothetical protein
MHALLPRETGTVEGPIPAEAPISPALNARSLKTLGERLRAVYGTVEPLPVRLTELLDRLARQESRPR